MRAIVCDRCGKVMLLAEDEEYCGKAFRDMTHYPSRVGKTYDLCEECVNEFFKPKENEHG